MPPADGASEPDAVHEAAAEDTYRLRVTDAVLSELVGACDDSDFSMALTLQAGGYLVSGVLVSMVEYFRGLAGLVRGADGGDTPAEALAAIAGLFDSHGDAEQGRRQRRMAALEADREPADPDDRVRPAYIHLRDAHLFGAGRAIMIPFWRGRLDHVDAFWLGSLSTADRG